METNSNTHFNDVFDKLWEFNELTESGLGFGVNATTMKHGIMDEIMYALDNLVCATVQKLDTVEKLSTSLKKALKVLLDKNH